MARCGITKSTLNFPCTVQDIRGRFNDKVHAHPPDELFFELNHLNRETILRSISFIGGLRWLNESFDLQLNFRGLGLAECYDGEHQSLNKAALLSKVRERSPNKRGNANIRDVEAGIAGVTDYLNLCNGHDFHKALASCIRSCGNNQVHDKAIAAGFRMTYRFQDFQESRLYEELKEWADKQSISLFSA